MKAQVSVEYLLLFAVSLVILIIVMQSISYISGLMKAYEDRSYNLLAKEVFLSSARDLCYIGSGSSIIVQLPNNVFVEGKKINGVESLLPCTFGSGNFSGQIVMRNNNGTINSKELG